MIFQTKLGTILLCSNTSLDKDKESDNESVDSKKTQLDSVSDGDSVSIRKKTYGSLKKFKMCNGSEFDSIV